MRWMGFPGREELGRFWNERGAAFYRESCDESGAEAAGRMTLELLCRYIDWGPAWRTNRREGRWFAAVSERIRSGRRSGCYERRLRRLWREDAERGWDAGRIRAAAWRYREQRRLVRACALAAALLLLLVWCAAANWF